MCAKCCCCNRADGETFKVCDVERTCRLLTPRLDLSICVDCDGKFKRNGEISDVRFYARDNARWAAWFKRNPLATLGIFARVEMADGSVIETGDAPRASAAAPLMLAVPPVVVAAPEPASPAPQEPAPVRPSRPARVRRPRPTAAAVVSAAVSADTYTPPAAVRATLPRAKHPARPAASRVRQVAAGKSTPASKPTADDIRRLILAIHV